MSDETETVKPASGKGVEERVAALRDELCFDLEAVVKIDELAERETTRSERVIEQLKAGLGYQNPGISTDAVKAMIRGIPIHRLIATVETAMRGEEVVTGKKPASSPEPD